MFNPRGLILTLTLALLLTVPLAATAQDQPLPWQVLEQLKALTGSEELAKVTASDGAANDELGYAVAISEDGNTIVVGARWDDDAGSASGSAYIFERDYPSPDSWGEVTKLTASDAATGDEFGYSVSISGNTVVVGANRDDDAGSMSGSAYVFERNQGGADNWGQVTKLTASDAATDDWFGASVSISGDTVVVGASGDDDTEILSGSAYVFERNQGGADNWGEVKKLTASDPTFGAEFGISVSISGDTVVIGAYFNSGPATWSGSAYVFERHYGGADNWGEVKKLMASDGAEIDLFGTSVSISGDTVVVGAILGDGVVTDSGSAYIFERDYPTTDNWGEVTKLTASDGADGDWFGYAVSISGNTVVVGAYYDDDAGGSSGSAYIFARNRGGADNWGEVTKVTASDAAAGDQFGIAVSISGNTVVTGARLGDGVESNSGSAYLYQVTPEELAKLTASDGAVDDQFGLSVSVSGDLVVVGAPEAGGWSGAAYIFERHEGGVDNWGEVTRLTASGGGTAYYFGYAVGISGDTVVVGAPFDASSMFGSAYIFERNEGGVNNWGQVIRLTASDGAASDYFGISVGISGDTVVVGAQWGDGVVTDSGSAYIFERDYPTTDNWGEVTKLMASDGADDDYFGASSVSISGDTVVVGADGDDDAGSMSGSAYIFERHYPTLNNWGQRAKLTASDAATGDYFGQSVGISGDTVVVGAGGDDAPDLDSGSAYIFERDQGGPDNWGQVTKLTASDGAAYDDFGVSVGISGNTVVTGARLGDGVESNSGSSYLFARHEGGVDNWGEVGKLTASDGAAGDWFGASVSISGNLVMVGARLDDDAGSASGSAYLFFYTPQGVPCVVDADCDDGLWCNGSETCNGGCEAGSDPCPDQSCDEVNKVCGCTIDDDFEAGAPYWTNDLASTCTAGDYVTGNPTNPVNGYQIVGSHSGTTSIFTATNTSAGVDDVDGGNCILGSPSWRVTNDSTLSVWYWHGQRDAGDDPQNGPQDAVYDSGLGAPKCAVAGSECDSTTLLDSRDSLTPAEPNQPNTLDTCTDGTLGTYHFDESNDRIVVKTLDGRDMVVGATVQVEATVYAWSTGIEDHLDLYYAEDANSPNWLPIELDIGPSGGVQTLSAQYTLPAGSLQAVRAIFRYQGSSSSCGIGGYDDTDDLVFAVGDDPAGDFFILEYSTDDGMKWTRLASNGDSTSNPAWLNATAQVPAVSTVQLRMQCSDGAGPGDLVECGIDDVSICDN